MSVSDDATTFNGEFPDAATGDKPDEAGGQLVADITQITIVFFEGSDPINLTLGGVEFILVNGERIY